VILLAGSANPALVSAVASELGTDVGAGAVGAFPDGELHVRVDADVRGRDVWIVQPTGPPVERHLVELVLLADACWRAGSGRVNAAVPYFGYARQDRRSAVGEALGGRVMADLVGTARLASMLVVDVHSPAVEAMLGMPVRTLTAVPLLAAALQPWVGADHVVVAPDLGAVKLAERYADVLGLPVAHVRKTRLTGTTVRSEEVVGPVKGRTAVIVDDMISTGGTIAAALHALQRAGCDGGFLVAATHPVLAGSALETLGRLPLQRLFITDTLVPPRPLPGPTEVVSIAPVLAAAMADHG
jgi:ribose-phosphate pyrophosphokinase